MRRDKEHQFGLFLLKGLRLEESADNGNRADDGNARQGLRFGVVEQARECERLTIAQFNTGLGATSAERWNYETVETNAIAEVDRGDFRLEFETDVVFVDDGRFEVETDAILFPHDGHAVTAIAHLEHRYGELTTGEEARLLTVHRDQVWLGQLAEGAFLTQHSQHRAGIDLTIENEKVQRRLNDRVQDGSARAGRAVAQNAWTTTTVPITTRSSRRAGQERRSVVAQLVAVNFRDADLKLNLHRIANRRGQHVDDFEIRRFDHALHLRSGDGIRDATGDHDRTIGLTQADVVFRKQRANLGIDQRQVGADVNVKHQKLTAGLFPGNEIDLAESLTVDEHLVRRDQHCFGDFGIRH